MNIVLRPAAVTDVRDACEYYDEAKSGLGEELVADLDRIFSRLEVFPRSAPVVAGYDPIRRAILRRFPYGVFYVPDTRKIDVLRIVHTARDAGAWRG